MMLQQVDAESAVAAEAGDSRPLQEVLGQVEVVVRCSHVVCFV